MPEMGLRSPGPRLPTAAQANVSWIDKNQMIEIDRIMIEDLGISLVQMMENAGRNLADLVIARFSPRSVLVLAGGGGNGGGGLVAARHLHNLGVGVTVLPTADRDRFSIVAAQQLNALAAMSVPQITLDEVRASIDAFDLVVDAMVGYSLSGSLRGDAADATALLNAAKVEVLSLDAPSGVDVSASGVESGSVTADATMTLCLPKVGLAHSAAVGELYLADISVPPEVTASFGTNPAPPFDRGRVLHLI